MFLIGKAKTIKALILASVMSTCVLAQGQVHVEHAYEPAVLDVIEAIGTGDLTLALTKVGDHLEQFPKSRIGHLLKADILQAMAQPLSGVAHTIAPQSDMVKGLKHQLKNRWQHVKSSEPITHTHFPSSMIEMGHHDHVIVADMEEGRLYLYRNSRGQPELLRDYYMTVGSAGYGKQVEGDNKTPVGLYSIYRYLSDAELPDLYGSGAFPVDYPNRWDRFRKRTGYGIWLHGTPSNTYARSPWASEGCFVVSNDDFSDIEKYIDVEKKTPVILSDGISWVTAEQLEQRRADYFSIIARWKHDWESLHTESYLEHYSKDNFNFSKSAYRPWAERKREVNKGKTFVQVDMDIESLFSYPGEQDMFVVTYKQRYLSNNYHGEANKKQYWQRDPEGRWKIIFEG